MINYCICPDTKVESYIDFWLVENAGVLSLSELEIKLENTFSCVPILLINEEKLIKLGKDKRLEHRIESGHVYHKKFDIFEKIDGIYNKAKNDGMVKICFDGSNKFEYVLINSFELPKELNLYTKFEIRSGLSMFKRQCWNKPTLDSIKNNGFYIFVLKDHVPNDFHDFVALHEYIELLTKSCGEATKYEFSKVAEKDTEFLNKFTKWYATLYKQIQLSQEHKIFLREILPELSIKIFEEENII